MAQTGYTPILIYSSSTGGNAPAAGNLTNSTLGSELAINITDGKLFYKDNGGNVQVIAWKTTPTTAGGTGLTSYTAGDTLYYATGTTLSKLAIGSSGYYMSSSGTAPQWSAPAALTKTDDTNVTLTLGGSASTALLNAASLTLGWTGQLAVSRGGTGIGSYTAGDLLYASGTTTLSKLAIGTANYVLTSSGSAPQWTAGSSVSVGTASNLLSNATTGVMQIVGPAASTTRVMTIPNANFTAARTDAAQTFTGDQTFSNNVGIGEAPNASYALWVKTALSAFINNTNATGYGLLIRAASTSASTALDVQTYDGGSYLFRVRGDGLITAPGVYASTSASAANVYVDSDGILYRSTSALKYKQNIRDLEEMDILKLKPVRYNSKCESDDQTKDFLGLIADWVDEAGFKELVIYGDNGEVEGFNYERLTVVLLKSLQTLRQEVDVLKAKG